MQIQRGFRTWLTSAAAAALFAMTLCSGAQAHWLKATSPNFIVYSQQSEAKLRDAVGRLEEFDALLRFYNPGRPPAVRRLPVYLVSGDGLQIVSPGLDSDIVGFYLPAAAEMMDIELQGDDKTLFHEYTHHFAHQYSQLALPSWYDEGFAEYMSTAVFKPDGTVEVGRYSAVRIDWLEHASWLSLDKVIGQAPFDFQNGMEIGVYYAQAWLLTHYILRDHQLSHLLPDYLKAVGVDGEKPWPAFARIFKVSSLGLESDLRDYADSRNVTFSIVSNFPRPDFTIKVEDMPASADDLLLYGLRAAADIAPDKGCAGTRRDREARGEISGRCVRAQCAGQRADRLRRPAKGPRYSRPGERLERRFRGALPGRPGNLELAKKDAAHRPALVTSARQFFGEAFKLDPSHYQTLYCYVQTFMLDGQPMPDGVLNVLIQAHNIAPQVREIGLETASELMKKRPLRRCRVRLAADRQRS